MQQEYTITFPHLTIHVKGSGTPQEATTLAAPLPSTIVVHQYYGAGDGEGVADQSGITQGGMRGFVHPSHPVFDFGAHYPDWQHLKLDFRVLLEWGRLTKEIETWLVALPHETASEEYQWGLDAFWMAFTAAHPQFPLGVWPDWDSRVPMSGPFLKGFFDNRFSSGSVDSPLQDSEAGEGDSDGSDVDSDDETTDGQPHADISHDERLLEAWRALSYHLLLIR